MSSKYPEVDGNIVHFKFKGRGQRETPVTGARGIIEVIMLLPGQQAPRVRQLAEVTKGRLEILVAERIQPEKTNWVGGLRVRVYVF